MVKYFSRAAGTGVATLILLGATALLSGQAGSGERPPKAWTVPRAPDGKPDLQGVFDYSTATPLQRPAAFKDKAYFTDEEAMAFLEQAAKNRARIDDAPPPGQVGGYNAFWYEFGTKVVPDRRTSLIVDPPDGQLPPLTPAAQARKERHQAHLKRLAEGPEDRDASERCILGYNSGPPMIGVGYNQHVQIVQTRDYVMLHNEMVHSARIAPFDTRARLPESQRTWSGESRARWDGDTLVVETEGFNSLTWNQFNGWNWAADENLHVVERFTLVDPDTITYEFTVTDPTVWTRPWSGVSALHRTTNLMFEYACHEGNYGMEGILRGARAEERRAK
ncbi:MAG: hypothetical protein FJW27_13130 [Acidimicrobiia bacterium]|nr:hypothetical protein [Acidimicrobiia bacterium]